MGNKDGLTSASIGKAKNQVIHFEGGYFSFAFGDEIALVVDDSYYILNCSSKVFDLIKEKIKSKATRKDLITFWKKQSKNYEISSWSENFDVL